MAYIVRRQSVYYLNLRLPKHLFRNRHTLRFSLNLRERQEAQFVASRLAQQVLEHLSQHPTTGLETLRALCSQWHDTYPAPLLHERSHGTAAPLKRYKTNGPTLAELSKKYIAEGRAGGTWREVSMHEVERSLRDLFELMGDMPALAFDMQQARVLKDRLIRCPQYFALLPEFKGRTLLQVVESGGTYKTITAVTVNNRLRKLSAFLNWCRSNGYVVENPLVGMKVMTGSAKDARASFEQHDLTTLLNLDQLKMESRKHPWRYWLPLLARFTGARLEELCQLHIDDIATHQGIPCIRVDDRHDDQKLKNQSSRRVLPIHPRLQELGLLEYVESVRVNSGNRLFPDLVATRDKLGHAPSKWFSRYKKKHGITDPRKTFHSFRHTFIDDLRDAGVQDSLIKRLVGHEDTSATFGIYGSRLPLKAMLDAINKLPLPAEGIDKSKITD